MNGSATVPVGKECSISRQHFLVLIIKSHSNNKYFEEVEEAEVYQWKVNQTWHLQNRDKKLNV